MNDETHDLEGSAAVPFARLTPERVLDALDTVLMTVGVRTDGRMLPLNSYENRVYQIGVEDGAPVVAKFYRPERWTDAAILEEHAFVSELAAREIPAVPAREFEGRTLHEFEGFRFSIFERRRIWTGAIRLNGWGGLSGVFMRWVAHNAMWNGRLSTSRASATSRASSC
jgi:hypothetical protein